MEALIHAPVPHQMNQFSNGTRGADSAGREPRFHTNARGSGPQSIEFLRLDTSPRLFLQGWLDSPVTVPTTTTGLPQGWTSCPPLHMMVAIHNTICHGDKICNTLARTCPCRSNIGVPPAGWPSLETICQKISDACTVACKPAASQISHRPDFAIGGKLALQMKSRFLAQNVFLLCTFLPFVPLKRNTR